MFGASFVYETPELSLDSSTQGEFEACVRVIFPTDTTWLFCAVKAVSGK
jgi:hypothetical protein